MSESPILTDLASEGVFTITFNRPEKKNAFNKAQWPLSALREMKRCLKLFHKDNITAAKASEDEGMRKLVGSPENIEAITAFMEKRKPDFKKKSIGVNR